VVVQRIAGLEPDRIIRVVVVGESPTSISGEVTSGFSSTTRGWSGVG
jgi:hypothetical protein